MIKQSNELQSNFIEDSLCDYIKDLECKQKKVKNHINKQVLSGKISDARHSLNQCLNASVRHSFNNKTKHE